MLRVDALGERLPPGSQSCDLWRGRLGHASENGITCNFSAPDASKQDDRLRLGSARRESCDSDRDRAGNRRLAAMRPYMHPDTFSSTGFVLDGGGFDGRGGAGHVGGHVRLSPVFKEYLWEVDIMAQPAPPALPYPTPPGGFPALLNAVAADYSDETAATGLPAPRDTGRGAGIRVYWVIDDTSMIHGVFGPAVNADRFAQLYRHPILSSEFVHVLFVDDHMGGDGRRGVSQGYSLIFMRKIANWIVNPANLGIPWDLELNLRYTLAHETTHLILNTRNQNGFDNDEHEIDPDGNGVLDGVDARSLMFRFYSWPNQNAAPMWFDLSIKQVELRSKEGVER